VVEVSETNPSARGGSDDRRGPVARDHDGYSHSKHFFGDACPGGHLDAVFDTELRPYSTHNDPWMGAGGLGERYDIGRRPTEWLDNEERFIREIRGDETFAWERFERGTGPSTTINRAQNRRWERRLMEAEESWDSLDPYYDGTFE
jgi:hypothetical protein